MFNWFSLSQIFLCDSQMWESFNSLSLIPGDNLSPCQLIIGRYFFPQIALHLAFTIVEWNMQILVKVYSDLHWIQTSIPLITWLVSLILTHWRVIFPVNSAIQRWNNRGQDNKNKTNFKQDTTGRTLYWTCFIVTVSFHLSHLTLVSEKSNVS